MEKTLRELTEDLITRGNLVDEKSMQLLILAEQKAKELILLAEEKAKELIELATETAKKLQEGCEWKRH